jgi:hypothetical protein
MGHAAYGMDPVGLRQADYSLFGKQRFARLMKLSSITSGCSDRSRQSQQHALETLHFAIQ